VTESESDEPARRHVSERLDAGGIPFGDDESWQTPEVIESMRAIMKHLDAEGDSISGWSSLPPELAAQLHESPEEITNPEETDGEVIA